MTNPFAVGALQRGKRLATKCAPVLWTGIEPSTIWLRDEVSNYHATPHGLKGIITCTYTMRTLINITVDMGMFIFICRISSRLAACGKSTPPSMEWLCESWVVDAIEPCQTYAYHTHLWSFVGSEDFALEWCSFGRCRGRRCIASSFILLWWRRDFYFMDVL